MNAASVGRNTRADPTGFFLLSVDRTIPLISIMTPEVREVNFESTPPMEFIPLSALEARVLGCLIEKELATPDIYPLTTNALVNACNQRSNRDPIIQVGPREVELALEQLRAKSLAVRVV